MAGAPVSGVAPVAAAENDFAEGSPRGPYPPMPAEEDDAREGLIDAIDPDMAYRAAAALLRREGLVGLLLNRHA
jgi:hypothetical protein